MWHVFLPNKNYPSEGTVKNFLFESRKLCWNFKFFKTLRSSFSKIFWKFQFLKHTPNDIQNKLISIINEELIETIKQEIEETDFAALMLDEALDPRRRSQLSTVLSYVVKGGKQQCYREVFWIYQYKCRLHIWWFTRACTENRKWI